jgi:hypothetical protein
MDDMYHGTHVSGTIGAVGNNGSGVVGVNWTASIMGCKFLDGNGTGTNADAIKCLDFIMQAKAILGNGANVRVLSNSWGGGELSLALRDAIERAGAANMLFVASAGNNHANHDLIKYYPASYEDQSSNIIVVAASTNTDTLASFSDYGTGTVHLAAPGENILSTMPGPYYTPLSGTSMAVPHVSGALALLLSKCNLDSGDLKTMLLKNVDEISALKGLVGGDKAGTKAGGRLNVNKAIRECAAGGLTDFYLSTSPSSRGVAPGSTASFTVTITSLNDFAESASLSVSGLPTDATATFSPNLTATTSTLNIITSSTLAPGTFPLTITGVSGSLSRSTFATLVVGYPDFAISVSPTSVTASQGDGITLTVSVSRLIGFSDNVSLSISGLPPAVTGTTYTLTPNSVSGTSSSLFIRIGADTPNGDYPLTITGVSGDLVRSMNLIFTVAYVCSQGAC